MAVPPRHQADSSPRAVTSPGRRPGTPAAERKRLQRERDRQLVYETADWRLFIDLLTLPQKAGCQPGDLRKVILKELVDNGLDCGGTVTLDYENGVWIVSDDGPGINPADVPRLFWVNRKRWSPAVFHFPHRICEFGTWRGASSYRYV